MFMPHVVEKTGRSEKPIDLPSRLLQDRLIYIGSPITPELANVVIMQLLWLQADSPDEDIELYISSPGGSVYDGLAIKDIIHTISCNVNTTGVGLCASMGAYLLSCGTGTRKVTENCRIMIHSVSSSAQGSFQDLEVDFEETKFLQDKMISDIQKFTKSKSTLEDINSACQRNFYMSPETALDMGIIDTIRYK
jgi:ATP-dependent Clp protease protease subunit